MSYDSQDWGGVFILYMPTGPVKFYLMDKGLHYLDLTFQLAPEIATMLVNTVVDNYKGYTWQEVTKAHEACRFQQMIACSTELNYQGMVHEKLLANCPVSFPYMQNAHQILALIL